MNKHIVIFTLLTITVTMCASSVIAQSASGTVKGVCKDAQGSLVVDGEVVWANAQTGQKYFIRTNRMGQYFSLGIAPAIYNVTLYKNANDAQSNREISHINGFQVLVDENVLNFEPQCEALEAVQIDDNEPNGPGHCAGEVDYWFTNTSLQPIDCAIIFRKNGHWDTSSVLTFALRSGERSGGAGKISSCGADKMQYQCFAHAENAANSCTGKIQWQQ